MPGMMKGAMYKKGGAVKKGAAKFQEGGLVDRSEAKRRRETAANTVRSVDAMPSPRSRVARGMAETALEDADTETRRLQRDNMERGRMGGVAKYQEGGQVRRRRGPSMEEDMTPPPGMRGFRSNAVPTDEPPPGRVQRRSFEEDMTPPRGMRGFRSNAVPTDEPMPGRRMKKGGVVKKAKGGMIGKGCK